MTGGVMLIVLFFVWLRADPGVEHAHKLDPLLELVDDFLTYLDLPGT